MLALHRGLVLVACVSAGFVISAGPGLIASAAEPDVWVKAITANTTTPSASAPVAPEATARLRIAELEQRVKELEAERRAQPGGQSAELAAIIARNEELAARNLALAVKNQELEASRLFEPPAPVPVIQPSDADPRAQLRYWAQLIRDDEATSGRLSPEMNTAVNLLLRRERQLDPQNPWR